MSLICRVVFVFNVVDNNGAIDPIVLVFAQEAITPHNVPLKEAVSTYSEQHITGTCWAKMGARTVDRGDDVLVEEDEFFGDTRKGVFARWWHGRLSSKELGIFAPRLDIPGCVRSCSAE